MKTGIIGLPQVGKTSLFRILTKANLTEQAYSNPREAHVGVAKVPDERLDKLAAWCDTVAANLDVHRRSGRWSGGGHVAAAQLKIPKQPVIDVDANLEINRLGIVLFLRHD